MNAHNLLFSEALQPTAGTFEAQRQVFPGFIFLIRLKCDRVEALFTVHQCVQPRQQGFFTEQEHMGPAFRTAYREA